MAVTTLKTPIQNAPLLAEIIYPDSDGQPIADNARHFNYIVMIQGGLAALFTDETFVEMAQRAETERQRAKWLAERLRALGLGPDME